MFTVLNSLAVLYLNLIGRNEYSCQKSDQAKAPLKRGQNSATKTLFWPLCPKRVVAFKQGRITAKWNQKSQRMTIFS